VAEHGSDVELSRTEACRLLLAHQRLLPPRSLRGDAGVLAYLSRAGSIQFDPLDVVGRNPDLVLQARVRGYRPRMLESLLYRKRALVEGWDKQASIYPVEDWPAFARQREHYGGWYRKRSTIAARLGHAVLARIQTEGPLSAHDLDHDTKVDWPWGSARVGRAALEALSFSGGLVIHHRERTLKVYDLASRALPAGLCDAPDPRRRTRDYLAWRVLRRIRGVGLLRDTGSDVWQGIPGVKTPERRALLALLRRRGEILAVSVEGVHGALYMAREDEALIGVARSRAGAGRLRAACLAPLDNLLWDRSLVKALFDFDYVWEVYKPASERRWGYYVLPVLCGDRFVARFEPARDPRGRAHIKRWWWEPGVERSPELLDAVRQCLVELAEYAGEDPAFFARRVAARLSPRS
jgi:uncharacterized protein